MPEYDLAKLAGSFDRVARYFNIVRPLFIVPYRRAAEQVLNKLPGTSTPRVLDIGTGTGTLAGVFAERRARVTGVDISEGMLQVARQMYGDRVEFIRAPAHAPGPFADRSFDVVTAGFVLHEMPSDYREQVLQEMKRLAAHLVVVVDYVPNYNPVVALVERVEGSFYCAFLAEIDDQLARLFPRVEIKKLTHFMGLYLALLSDVEKVKY